ncbi:MAG: glycoside hydrolase family 3 N-terminal domain-containing protein [Candidatus Neomarinimicrobiota bacterium]
MKQNYHLIKCGCSVIILCILIISACVPPGEIMETKPWSERTLDALSLREKISQMLIYSIHLEFMNETHTRRQEIEKLIKTDGIGGLHLWSGTVGQSLATINEFQRQSKIPILVDADIERGLYQRFRSGTQFPPAQAITATGDPKNAYEVGQVIGSESRAVGIHLNLAPVADINSNSENPIINIRSFSDDPELVGIYVGEFIRGLHSTGMLATAKHFPGHGDTKIDSHSSMATISGDSSRMWSTELIPFKAAISAGVDAVMISHIQVPNVQPNGYTPATFSEYWIKDILRNKLGFKGAVITDAMDMGSIVNNYSDAYAIIEAINAGCDIIIQNHDFSTAVSTIERAVYDGHIKVDRINEAALRMLKLKEKSGLHLNRFVNIEKMRKVLRAPKYLDLASNISSQAITLVKNDHNLLPLDLSGSDEDALVIFNIYGREFDHSRSVISGLIEKEFRNSVSMSIDESDSTYVLNAIVEHIPRDKTVLLNVFSVPQSWKGRIFLTQAQTNFIRDILQKSKRVILVSFGNPYLIHEFPEVPSYLVGYHTSELIQKSVYEALVGITDIQGVLPVNLDGIAKRGHGIKLMSPGKIKKPATRRPLSALIRIRPHEIGAKIDPVMSLIAEAVQDSAFPGGVLLAAKDGKVFIHEAFGYQTYDKREMVNRGDIFDLASLTKPIATTSAVMLLEANGVLDVDRPIIEYLPKFGIGPGSLSGLRKTVTLRHLLSHSSGLPAFQHYYSINGTVSSRLDSVIHTELEYIPGEKTVYSDVGMILLGLIIEQVSEKKLDDIIVKDLFQPLGMNLTMFNPSPSLEKRIIPTEWNTDSSAFIKGIVHDENARSFGGVSGHAGLFSTAFDLAIFSQMMLGQGHYRGVNYFTPTIISKYTSPANIIAGNSRCLGWDSPSGQCSGGIYLSSNSYGHVGFTGTSLWIDPDNRVFVIFLTNAVHPDRNMKDPKYYDWCQKIHSAVYESMGILTPNPRLEWRPRWKVNKHETDVKITDD